MSDDLDVAHTFVDALNLRENRKQSRELRQQTRALQNQKAELKEQTAELRDIAGSVKGLQDEVQQLQEKIDRTNELERRQLLIQERRQKMMEQQERERQEQKAIKDAVFGIGKEIEYIEELPSKFERFVEYQKARKFYEEEVAQYTDRLNELDDKEYASEVLEKLRRKPREIFESLEPSTRRDWNALQEATKALGDIEPEIGPLQEERDQLERQISAMRADVESLRGDLPDGYSPAEQSDTNTEEEGRIRLYRNGLVASTAVVVVLFVSSFLLMNLGHGNLGGGLGVFCCLVFPAPLLFGILYLAKKKGGFKYIFGKSVEELSQRLSQKTLELESLEDERESVVEELERLRAEREKFLDKITEIVQKYDVLELDLRQLTQRSHS